MSEGSRYFEGTSAVQAALRKIADRLGTLHIPYAVAGGMALFQHGYRRFTEDVDILVSRAGLQAIHQALDGLGYVPPFHGSKNLRDPEHGVKIEFLVAGDYPGDGKPKPVCFPDPEGVALERDGVRYLQLPTLIELKLASGMTNVHRHKDLVDVEELIRRLDLPADYANELNDYVRPKYAELWQAMRGAARRYARLWRDEELSPYTLDDLLADGVTVEKTRGDGSRYLVTTDPALAQKYDMHDEAEFLNDNEV